MSTKSRVSILSLEKISLKSARFNRVFHNQQTGHSNSSSSMRRTTPPPPTTMARASTNHGSRISNGGDTISMVRIKPINLSSKSQSSKSSLLVEHNNYSPTTSFKDRPFEAVRNNVDADANITATSITYRKFFYNRDDTPTTVSTTESIVYDDDDLEDVVVENPGDPMAEIQDDRDDDQSLSDRVSIRKFQSSSDRRSPEVITSQPQRSNLLRSDPTNEVDSDQRQPIVTQSRPSLQSTELSFGELHKLETIINNGTSSERGLNKMMVNSNAWNDDQQQQELNHHHKNAEQIQWERIRLIHRNIYKKDRWTVFCFCASTLAGIMSLAVYCTQ